MGNFKSDVEIKLIALDMDGTLLNKEGEISIENRKAIKEAEEHGIYVVLSTGRSIMTCRIHAESLELTSYLITVNGSEIWNDQGQLVERNLVHYDQVQWLLSLAQIHKTNYWATCTERTWHDEMPEDVNKFDWLKFGFNTDDDDIRGIILNELQKRGEFEISNSNLENLEVNAAGINKAKGLKIVCEKLGIEMKDVMAIGDSLNDIAMIKEAGLGIAMGNAQEIVKGTANWVTATNEEDGVAVAIRKWVLQK